MIDIKELSQFRIFKGLNERELELIAKIATKKVHEPGARLFEEKALATDLYLVLDGKVEIKIRGNEETQVVIDQIEAGEIFGWSVVAEPYTFTAAAWTLEKTKLIVLNGERLRDLFEKNNHIGYRIVKEITAVVSRRLKAMETKFVSMMHQVKE
ncbi:MAG: cyclic nucleotide-binding domain-containing protein [bacterium]